ncbi:hypothetical protein KKB10_06300 [Patescibacteria group bacterium]|nr:hypothetical protein [Patescibacteria group bacterium]
MATKKQPEIMTEQKISTQLSLKADQIITLLTFTAVAASFFAAALILTSFNLAK